MTFFILKSAMTTIHAQYKKYSKEKPMQKPCSMQKKIESLDKKNEDTKFHSYNDIRDFVTEHASYRALADDITQMGILARSLAKKYNLDDSRKLDRIKLRNKIRDEVSKSENFEQVEYHILRIVDAIIDEEIENYA